MRKTLRVCWWIKQNSLTHHQKLHQGDKRKSSNFKGAESLSGPLLRSWSYVSEGRSRGVSVYWCSWKHFRHQYIKGWYTVWIAGTWSLSCPTGQSARGALSLQGWSGGSRTQLLGDQSSCDRVVNYSHRAWKSVNQRPQKEHLCQPATPNHVTKQHKWGTRAVPTLLLLSNQ